MRPVRVLHVVGAMNRGGVETWLMDVLRQADRPRVQMDFLVHAREKAAFDDEIAALGSRIIRCPHTRHPLTYARQFSRLAANYGPYDVVHSHVHLYSGFVLFLAARAGVPQRIAHSHSDTRMPDAGGSPWRKAYAALMKSGIRAYATMGLAASRRAAAALFGPDWQRHPRRRVLYYGIDVEKFLPRRQPEEIKQRLGLPAGSQVVMHTGRFDLPKNHTFMIEIASGVIRRNRRAHFVFIGDGPLRPAIEQGCQARNIAPRCHFLGLRGDVPELLSGADAFLFPSRYEGLGLVLIEAQAAGVPCICSNVVPEEADVVPHLVTRLPLDAGAAKWSDAVLAVLSSPRRAPFPGAESPLKKTAFTIQKSAAALMGCYLNA